MPFGSPSPSIPPTSPLAAKLTYSPAVSAIPVSVHGSGPGTETEAGMVVADACAAGSTITVKVDSAIAKAIDTRAPESLSSRSGFAGKILARTAKVRIAVPPR